MEKKKADVLLTLDVTRFNSYLPFSFRKADEKDGAPEKAEFCTEARISLAGGKVEITYDESKLLNCEGSYTRISFDVDRPDTVSILRKGRIRCSTIYSPGLRHNFTYVAADTEAEMTVITKTVKNTVLTDGKLEMDYILEIRGQSHCRTFLKLHLKKHEKKPED